MTAARVLSINIGAVREVDHHGERITTGIWKSPVAGRVALRGVNFDGDDQADRSVHGGPDKAVYAYAQEDYEYWRAHEATETTPGLFGENLTVVGLDLRESMIGDQWRLGSTVLEIVQPRLPCFKLGIRMDDPRFLKRFLAAGRVGAYLRVIQEGDVGAGDEIVVTRMPDGGVTLREMIDALQDRSRAQALLRAPRLPAFWHELANA